MRAGGAGLEIFLHLGEKFNQLRNGGGGVIEAFQGKQGLQKPAILPEPAVGAAARTRFQPRIIGRIAWLDIRCRDMPRAKRHAVRPATAEIHDKAGFLVLLELDIEDIAAAVCHLAEGKKQAAAFITRKPLLRREGEKGFPDFIAQGGGGGHGAVGTHSATLFLTDLISSCVSLFSSLSRISAL